MTKTAHRALQTLVAGFAAAATLVLATPATSAQAQEGCGFEDPSVPGGWVATDCPTGDEGVQPQLPSERIGRVIDTPDGRRCTVVDVVNDQDVIDCYVIADPSFREDAESAPVPAPAPQVSPAPQASAPVARVDAQQARPAAAPGSADPGSAPAELDGELAPTVSWAQVLDQLRAFLLGFSPAW